MYKNGIIAVLGTMLIIQQPAYSVHRTGVVFVAMAAVLFVSVCILENEVRKYKRARRRQQKFKEQVENVHLHENRRQA